MSKILIIDDEMINRKMASFVLEKNGYETISAASGTEGIAMIKSQKPDLVLLDIEMPGMNGYDVLDQIRKDEAIADSKIVFYIGSVDIDAETKMTEYGVLDMVKKPVVAPELLNIIQKYI